MIRMPLDGRPPDAMGMRFDRQGQGRNVSLAAVACLMAGNLARRAGRRGRRVELVALVWPLLAVGCLSSRGWQGPPLMPALPASPPTTTVPSNTDEPLRKPPVDMSEWLIRAQDEPVGGGRAATGQPAATATPPGDPYAPNLGGVAPSFRYPQQGVDDPAARGVAPALPNPVPNPGDPNALNPLVQPYPNAGVSQSYFDNLADLDVYVQESQTGRFMVGGAYNSDNGLTGQITIDERNFDITRFPTRFSDLIDGRAFRGAGQGFRLELLPGRQVQRYLVSFTEPYLFNSLVSFSASGYFYDRRYFDWSEQRVGGQFSLGYRVTPELSISGGTRLESVNLFEPRVGTSPELNAALGDSSLLLGFVRLVHDTRDHPFLATEGAYFEAAYTQGFGDYDYPRGDLDYRRYFLVTERPDGSGRHTLSFGTRLGFTGSSTPVFENYFAGGFSSLRGYSFRGASPVEGGVRVGGEFQWLNSVEYMFPLTADDMIRGVVFCDFGTVEREIDLNMDNFRVAPGFGFRIHMPAAGGGGAPLAFDFAFPVASADGDERQTFSFYLGVNR